MLQVQDKRTTHSLGRTACFINLRSCYKHALHGWSASTLIFINLTLRCGPYQLIALSPSLPDFLSLSMLHQHHRLKDQHIMMWGEGMCYQRRFQLHDLGGGMCYQHRFKLHEVGGGNVLSTSFPTS